MEQGGINFEVAQSEDAAMSIAGYFFDKAYNKDQVFQKQFSQHFLSDMYHYLDSQKSSPITRFYTLYTLKEIVVRNDKKIIGFLITSQAFLDLLQTFALKTDPKKSLNEKGKKLFAQDKEGKYGNSFIRMLLELLVYLGSRFPVNSKGEPTKFKKILMKLEEQAVVLPKQFKYLPEGKSKAAKKVQPDASTQEKKEEKKGSSSEGLIKFVKCKIDEYIDNLDDIEDQDELQKFINKSHKIFQTEIEKFNQIGDAIYNEKQSVVMDFLNVKGFLEQENQLYNQYIKNNQYTNFFTKIKISYEEIYPQQNEKQKQKETPGNNNLQQSETPSIKKTTPVYVDPQNNKPTTPTVKKQEKSKYMSQPARQINSNSKLNQYATTSKFLDLGEKMQVLVSKLPSKSPISFSVVKNSLEKQKNNIHAHPPRNGSRVMSTSKVGASTLSKMGKVSNSIFKNVPNPSPPYKNYDGNLVTLKRELAEVLYDIKGEIEKRRFKVSNLRDKYSLLENNSLQIGFKSQAIYQQYDGYQTFISIDLFLGNKSKNQIKNLEMQFEGDENMLIYTSPRQIKSVIDADVQLKHELMLIPLRIPFSFANIKLSYTCGGVSTHATIPLPSSIVKMTVHMEMQKTQFFDYWNASTTILKSQIFKLSHCLPPNTLRKNITALKQLNIDYSQFSVSGNEQDYQLYCNCDIWNTYEGILKITIRPDLNVIIQIAAIDPSHDAIEHLSLYLQTMQLILQEN